MSVHTEAIQGLAKHPRAALSLFFVQLAVRVLALCPVWLPWVLSGLFNFSVNLPALWKCALCLLLFILIVLPMRFRGALVLAKAVSRRDLSKLTSSAYPRLLAAGLLRLCFTLLWGLPFAVCMYLAYLYVFVFDGSQFGKGIESIGAFLHRLISFVDPYMLGLFAVCFTFFISLLLLVIGLRRQIPFDFQMVGTVTPMQALRISGRVRKRCRKQLAVNALIHLLILLPPVLAAYVVFYVRFGGHSQVFFTLYTALIAGMTPDPGALRLALLLFLALYLPFILYRKARNAVAVVNCDDKNS